MALNKKVILALGLCLINGTNAQTDDTSGGDTDDTSGGDTDATTGGDTDTSTDTSTSSAQCYENNGGCSHWCNDSGCSCPPCWELDTDGLTCVPEADKAVTTCSAGGLKLTVDKCVFDSTHDYTSGKFFSGDCAFVEDGDTFVIESAYNDCGFGMSLNDDGKIEFANTVTVQPKLIQNLFYLSPELEWDVKCEYEAEYTVSSEITMDGSAVTEDFAVDNASFDFDFAFYMGQTLTTKRESHETLFSVGQDVVFGVTMNEGNELNNLEFAATQCTVSNANSQSFQIFNSADCSAASPVGFAHIMPASSNALRGYSFRGFQFNDNAPATQYVTCTIKVCKLDDTASDCATAQACYPDSKIQL